ncbi:MAG: imidazoleglycerol-phosphate dehydratase HisB [Chloroherpetonaceae bacterium]|nr:imidazoleglycerol-phosphate dehydratase HisB [Chthonomonadaceae bacterium]MDW8209181.1 imidazoleglycerol-phosphate dehydratase HisB [Chloroherpetonaceae bacterium]
MGDRSEGRTARIERQTTETQIVLSLDLDGQGQADIQTGIGFLDHMLTLLTRHALLDLTVRATGDLHVDAHHTVEDVGICLGRALTAALGDRAGIQRYGHMTLPMDEALVSATIDLSGRPFFVWQGELPREHLGAFPSELTQDFWHAVAVNAGMNLHIQCHYGRNTHHLIEGTFKAFARALRQAVAIDPRMSGVPSTKGVL